MRRRSGLRLIAVSSDGPRGKTLLEQVAAVGPPLYGLARPRAMKSWIASIGDGSVGFGYRVEGDRPDEGGVEIEVGFTHRTAFSEGGRRAVADAMRLGIASELMLKARYPAGDQSDRGGEWWHKLALDAYEDAKTLAGNREEWKALALVVDGEQWPAWRVEAEGRWAVYGDRECGYVYVMGDRGQPGRDMQIETVSIDDVAAYEEPPED